MELEEEYSNKVGREHLKKFGQYFTNDKIAKFMCRWAGKNAKTMLDPASGNAIFLRTIKELYDEIEVTGFEIDNNILEFFNSPYREYIHNKDYLLDNWEEKYDCIVCNPPYNRFQYIPNKDMVLEIVLRETGIKLSGYSNLYSFFLLKSIYQMSDTGRLAFIIPTEFLNSKYGEILKDILIKEKLIRAIINFKNNDEIFINATTTSCILLLDKERCDKILFYNINSIDDLENIEISENDQDQNNKDNIKPLEVEVEKIQANEKWRIFLNHEEVNNFNNLVDVSNFCKTKRGIATGANEYFCFTSNKIQEFNLSLEYLVPCITKSSDIKNLIFEDDDYESLVLQNKLVYLLNLPGGSVNLSKEAEKYIELGVQQGIDKKYLPSKRKHWYTMEKKDIAPIWVSSASRGKMKFIRNFTNTRTLTTFHSIYVNSEKLDLVDILYCYFLTPTAQSILRESRKELGNGLDKFQPNDINNAKMLNVDILTKYDKEEVLKIFWTIRNSNHTDEGILIDKLDILFQKYLLS